MKYQTIQMSLLMLETVIIILIVVFDYITAKVMGEKFDKLLIKHHIKLPPTFSFLPGRSDISLRAEKYSDCIFYNKSAEWRSKKRKDWYESFDFRAHASRKDILLARINKALSWAANLVIFLMIAIAIYYKVIK